MMFKTILTFYDAHRKTFPWRTNPVNPYYVYVSEIMLQQTTTQTVHDYFVRFVARFPTLQDLSKADVDQVLLLWQGLGYYSRGRNLHATAKLLGNNPIPHTYADLITLPGVGDYTAKAIMAIAYGKDVLPIDGNIKRILARYFGLDVPYAQIPKAIDAHTFDFYGRPGDVCQGLMDFANTICLARNPTCGICPLKSSCQAYLKGAVNQLPNPKKKVQKKIMVADGFVCIKDDCIGLNYHQPGTLLGNLWNVPMTVQSNKPLTETILGREVQRGNGAQNRSVFNIHEDSSTGPTLQCSAKIELCKKFTIRHIFTHIDLRLTLHRAHDIECDAFIPLKELSDYPLSRLTEKVLESLIHGYNYVE